MLLLIRIAMPFLFLTIQKSTAASSTRFTLAGVVPSWVAAWPSRAYVIAIAPVHGGGSICLWPISTGAGIYGFSAATCFANIRRAHAALYESAAARSGVIIKEMALHELGAEYECFRDASADSEWTSPPCCP